MQGLSVCFSLTEKQDSGLLITSLRPCWQLTPFPYCVCQACFAHKNMLWRQFSQFTFPVFQVSRQITGNGKPEHALSTKCSIAVHGTCVTVTLCNYHTVCFLVTKRSISSTSSTVTRLLVPPRPPPPPLLNISSREAAAVVGPT